MKTHITCKCGHEVLIPMCGNCVWYHSKCCGAPLPSAIAIAAKIPRITATPILNPPRCPECGSPSISVSRIGLKRFRIACVDCDESRESVGFDVTVDAWRSPV